MLTAGFLQTTTFWFNDSLRGRPSDQRGRVEFGAGVENERSDLPLDVRGDRQTRLVNGSMRSDRWIRGLDEDCVRGDAVVDEEADQLVEQRF